MAMHAHAHGRHVGADAVEGQPEVLNGFVLEGVVDHPAMRIQSLLTNNETILYSI